MGPFPPDFCMKILLVVTRADRGGAQTHVRSLAKGMKGLGHEVTVATGGNGWLTQELEALGVAIEIVPSLCRSWNPFATMWSFLLFRKMEMRPFPVIHLHSSNAILALLGSRRRRSAKLVATIHGWSLLSPGWRGSALRKRAYRFVMRLALRRAD